MDSGHIIIGIKSSVLVHKLKRNWDLLIEKLYWKGGGGDGPVLSGRYWEFWFLYKIVSIDKSKRTMTHWFRLGFSFNRTCWRGNIISYKPSLKARAMPSNNINRFIKNDPKIYKRGSLPDLLFPNSQKVFLIALSFELSMRFNTSWSTLFLFNYFVTRTCLIIETMSKWNERYSTVKCEKTLR